ncbi:hypothetical protein VYA_35710 [Vibrio alfacsensis]|nr:hypothetical protein VYA_35710 [Vibrio alfacsensis]
MSKVSKFWSKVKHYCDARLLNGGYLNVLTSGKIADVVIVNRFSEMRFLLFEEYWLLNSIIRLTYAIVWKVAYSHSQVVWHADDSA